MNYIDPGVLVTLFGPPKSSGICGFLFDDPGSIFEPLGSILNLRGRF